MLRKPQPQSYAAIESEQVGANAVVTRMRGHVTRLLTVQQFDQFRLSLSGMKKAVWIIDVLDLTGFDPGAVAGGADWFSTFKERDGQQVIFVAAHSAARMAAAALAFAVHAKFSAVDTLAEAYERAGLGNVEPRPSLFALMKRDKTG